MNEYLPKERGNGLKKEVYYSFCSAHQTPIKGCPRCEVGSWKKLWVLKMSNLFYKISPTLWRFQANFKNKYER